MRILIFGNLGYVGPELVKYLRKVRPSSTLIGYDIGYFMNCYTSESIAPESKLDVQYYGDVRNLDSGILKNVDCVIYLAAISNDPIGNKFEKPTLDINYISAISIANVAKEMKVGSFVYASSCSVYGINEGFPKNENDALNPLTPYAKSKILTEQELQKIASDEFKVTCLRFATACGMSDRLRLDLVLNDFAANAYLNKRIEILSDGTPFRPLINVKDMARAMEWAIDRVTGDYFEVLNIGSDDWNFQIKDLAFAIRDRIGDLDIHINRDAPADKRSYQVSFRKFAELAPDHTPIYGIDQTIDELLEGLKLIGFKDYSFRASNFIRLNTINMLINDGTINDELKLL